MSSNTRNLRNSDNPLVIVIGMLAALVAVFAFATGIVDLPSVLSPEAKLQRQLVESWREPSGAILTFYENGTLEESGSIIPLNGSYMITDSSHITIQFSGLGALAGAQIWQVSVNGNTLYITNTWDGSNITATRVR